MITHSPWAKLLAPGLAKLLEDKPGYSYTLLLKLSKEELEEVFDLGEIKLPESYVGKASDFQLTSGPAYFWWDGRHEIGLVHAPAFMCQLELARPKVGVIIKHSSGMEWLYF